MSYQHDRKATFLQHIGDWIFTVYWGQRRNVTTVNANVVDGSLDQLILYDWKGELGVVGATLMQYLNKNGFDDMEIIALSDVIYHYHADGNKYQLVCTTFPNEL